MPHGHGEKLTRKQELLISALLSEPTVEAAARTAGVGYRTAKRWLTLPAFQAEYRAARRRVVEFAVGQLQGLASQAVGALRRNLRGVQAADQIRAAVAVLKHATHAIEATDVLERLEALEAKMGGAKR